MNALAPAPAPPVIAPGRGGMERDTKKMRGTGPFVFAQVKHGVGVPEIVDHIVHSWQHACGVDHHH